jgi:hypothetical protein
MFETRGENEVIEMIYRSEPGSISAFHQRDCLTCWRLVVNDFGQAVVTFLLWSKIEPFFIFFSPEENDKRFVIIYRTLLPEIN